MRFQPISPFFLILAVRFWTGSYIILAIKAIFALVKLQKDTHFALYYCSTPRRGWRTWSSELLDSVSLRSSYDPYGKNNYEWLMLSAKCVKETNFSHKFNSKRSFPKTTSPSKFSLTSETRSTFFACGRKWVSTTFLTPASLHNFPISSAVKCAGFLWFKRFIKFRIVKPF